MENKERTLKMSLEMARKFWKDDRVESLKEWILSNFTREELEDKKGYTWGESFDGAGYYLLGGSVKATINNPINDNKKDIFKTEKQALSALAFAELTHIVAKYNEGKSMGTGYIYIIKDMVRQNLETNTYGHINGPLYFHTLEDAKISLEVNKELWMQYCF